MRVYCSLVKQTEPELGNVSQICAFDPYTIHQPRDERLSDKLLIHTAFRPEDEGIKAASEEAHHISPIRMLWRHSHTSSRGDYESSAKAVPFGSEFKIAHGPPYAVSRIVTANPCLIRFAAVCRRIPLRITVPPEA